HPREACEAGAEFRVKDPLGEKANLLQTVEILTRGVEHPFDVANRIVQLRHGANGWRVEEKRPRSTSKHLDQVCPLRVAVAGCALRIDGDRSRASRYLLNRSEVLIARGDHRV